jgi:hypothetical protein
MRCRWVDDWMKREKKINQQIGLLIMPRTGLDEHRIHSHIRLVTATKSDFETVSEGAYSSKLINYTKDKDFQLNANSGNSASPDKIQDIFSSLEHCKTKEVVSGNFIRSIPPFHLAVSNLRHPFCIDILSKNLLQRFLDKNMSPSILALP